MTTELTRPGADSSRWREGSGALARLCSAPRAVFADDIWGRRAWLSPAVSLPGDPADLLTLDDIDELLSRRALRTPFLRLAKDGRVVPTGQFTGSGGVGAGVADQVLDEAVLERFADGTSVVLQGVHRLWPAVNELAADLAAELGHTVQVNAYITPPKSQGFAPHYDTHDVFVLQVAGRKHWRVHAPVRPSPLPGEDWALVADEVRARAAEAPTVEHVMEPGDCLYLPRGFIHAATAQGETSAHLTFGIHPVTEREAIRALVDALPDEPWRSSLPVGWGLSEPDTEQQLAALRDRLAAAVAALDPAAVAALLHDRRAAGQRPEPIPPLAQAAAASTLSDRTRVRWRRYLGARLVEDQAGQRLVLPGRARPVDGVEWATVQALAAGSTWTVADLPGELPLETVRRLLLAGVLVTEA